MAFPAVGPEVVKGIELNPYAAELARVSVWIGEIQWMRRNGFEVARKPILRALDTIECRDALLNADGTPAQWPDADAVVGYPDRILPVDDEAAKVLKTRTLTNLYNARPAWLANAHAALDQAVAEAYGWGGEWRTGMSDDDIRERLFALNQARAAAK